MTGCPVRTQSMQGPSSDWICISSVQSDSSLEEATTRSRPCGSTSMIPAASAASSVHAVPDEPVQHVDDVVVGDQGIGQPDERIGEQSLAVVLSAAHDRPSPETVMTGCPRGHRRTPGRGDSRGGQFVALNGRGAGPPSRPPSEACRRRIAEQGGALGQRQAAPHAVRLPDGKGVTTAVVEHRTAPADLLGALSRSAFAGPRSPSGWKNSALSRSRQAARSCHSQVSVTGTGSLRTSAICPTPRLSRISPRRGRRGPERHEHVFTSVDYAREPMSKGCSADMEWSRGCGAPPGTRTAPTVDRIGRRPDPRAGFTRGSTRRGHRRTARSSTRLSLKDYL